MNKDLIDRDVLFEKVTQLYRYSKGEVRIAYRDLLDFILDMESESVDSCDSDDEEDYNEEGQILPQFPIMADPDDTEWLTDSGFMKGLHTLYSESLDK